LNVPHLFQTSLDDILLKSITEFGEGVVILDLPRIIYANEAFSKITGYSEKELAALGSFFNLIPADEKETINGRLSSAMNNKTTQRFETTLLQKDGKRADIEIIANGVPEGDKTRVVLVVLNTTEQKNMAGVLKKRSEFEELITNLSAHFINLAPHLIDEGITNAIRTIGTSIQVDRIFLFPSATNLSLENAYEWYASPDMMAEDTKHFELLDFSWFSEKIKSQDVFAMSSLDDLPPEARTVKEHLYRRRIQSLVVVPMLTNGTLRGFLTFSALRAVKKWTPEDITVFKITGEMFANVIERKSNYAALKDNEVKFKEVFNNTIDPIYIYPLSDDGIPGKFIEVNEAACLKLGYSREELLEMSPGDINVTDAINEVGPLVKKIIQQKNITFEKIHVSKSGLRIPMEVNSHLFRWGDQDVVLSAARDISERKRAEEVIRRQAYYDVLTNLPNRSLFKDRLEQAMKSAHLNKQMLAVIILDLDRFKNINETLGHLLGDKLLVNVAERLLGILNPNETIARFGGDEFTLLMPQVNNAEEVTEHAQKILELLTAPFKLHEHELHVTTSIGIAFYPDDGEGSELLLKNAETAMYRAKDQGRNNFQLYASGMNVSAFKQLLMENSLRRALEKEEFVIYYQPQINLANQKVTGAEALVRWQHPDLGLVFPNEFIGLAEETGLIVPIGEWIIKKVCEQSKKWQAAGYEKMCISVNLSARQFQQLNLVPTIAKIIADTGLDPQYLGMEVTESIAMKNADFTIAALGEMKKMRIHLSLDDFGTGYSSLSYLKRFPLETLKIDRSFVRDITTDPNDAAIVTAVVALAHSMKLNVVAEGVETEGQLTFLRNHHCDIVQGYIFSHPLSEVNFLKFVKEYGSK
jgi:diguanylate cyclase (GGDEF)-like protein/PAS domain S-box-containing protein